MGSPFSIPKRYILVLLAHFGFFVLYLLRVNFSIAIVAMVNSTATDSVNSSSECPVDASKKNGSKSEDGEFNWSGNEQGIVLGAFFYGYLVSQIPSGWFSNKWSPKWMFGIGVLSTSILTLITPLVTRVNFVLLIITRVMEGLFEGRLSDLVSKRDSPGIEVGIEVKYFLISFIGCQTGAVLALVASGQLADSSILGGWPSVFYIFGAAGVLWFFLWMFFIVDLPNKHPTITFDEKTHILRNQNGSATNVQKSKLPWLEIVRSTPVLACMLARFCIGWVYYTILTELPSYFKHVLAFNLKENGLTSALPVAFSFILSLFAGGFADFLRTRYLSITNTRKLMVALSCYVPSAFLILSSYTSCNQKVLAVAYVTLANGFVCFNAAGVGPSLIDLSPKFAGFLMGITNFTGSISGCLAPLVTGYFTNDHPLRVQYRKVFIIGGFISAIGGTVYLLFGKSVPQPWNDMTEKNISVNDGDTMKHALVESSEENSDEE